MRTIFTKLRLNERLIKNTRFASKSYYKCPMCNTNSIESVELCSICICIYICNELGKGRPGTGERPASETGSTDDGLLGSSKNKHNPVMVYNDLMINNTSVSNCYINRS